MKPVKMVDLQGQYHKIKNEVDTAIAEVLESTAFINGPAVQKFQKNLADFLNVKHVITCGNGTDALMAALIALDLQPGDEVITTPFTFIATVEVICLLKLKPVFVDIEYDTFNMDMAQIEKVITPRTKVILPVHLFGQCCNMHVIKSLAEKYNLFIVEDACQAMGTDYIREDGTRQKAGTLGDIGCTSFFPSKNLGCYGDGGAIFTNSDALAYKLKGIVNHGMFERYRYEMIGMNSRLDTIQAAVLDIKLRYLEQYNHSRIEAAQQYNNAFKGYSQMDIPVTSSFSTHIFHQYTLKLKNINRENLIKQLQLAEIPVMIYYPYPIHSQEAYAFLGYRKGDFPVSETLAQNVISLPIHTELTTEQISYIINNFLSLI